MQEEIVEVNGLKTMLSRFHDDEHVQFMAFLVDDLPVKVESFEILKPIVGTLKNLTMKEDIIFRKKSFKDLTEDMAEYDKMRDALFRSCRNTLKDTALIGTEEEKEAVRRLEPTFDAYKDITKANYEGESSQVSNFVRDIRKLALASYVQTVGIKDRIDSLEAANANFIKAFKTRAYLQENQKSMGTMRDVRDELNDIFLSLVYAVNSSYISNTLGPKSEAISAKLISVADTINTFVDRFIVMLAHRGVHIARKKNQSGGEGGEGGEEAPPSGGGGGGMIEE